MVSRTEAVTIGLATRTDPDPRARPWSWPVRSRPAARTRSGPRSACSTWRADRLEAGFAAEQKEIAALIGSPNQAEAVAAEFARRPPQFTDPD